MKISTISGVCGAALLAIAAGCSVYGEDLVAGGGAGATGGGGAGRGANGGGGAGSTGGGGTGGQAECVTAADCPGADTECHTRTCAAGACGADDAPEGTALSQQVAGDCQVAQCDGSGGITSAPDDLDLPDDGKECTVDTCSAGAPVHTAVSVGTACTQGGGAHCNAAGDCVECTTGADCASLVCTAGFTCAAPACDDTVQNGSETDVDCGGFDCGPCATGLGCGADGDCIGGLCSGSTCAATCTDTQQNNAETDVDCGGPDCGPCGIGQLCTAASDCASGKCGVAGTCQYRVVISEIRSRGPAGASDDFVEIYNPTSAPVVLDNQWKIEARGSTAANYTTRWTGAGLTLAPHGHFLITGSAYSGAVTGDAALSSGLADASSVRLVHTTDVIDAICFYYNASTLADFQSGVGFTCEGPPVMSATGAANVSKSLERLPGGALGNGTDTDSNTADFVVLDPSDPQNAASAPVP